MANKKVSDLPSISLNDVKDTDFMLVSREDTSNWKIDFNTVSESMLNRTTGLATQTEVAGNDYLVVVESGLNANKKITADNFVLQMADKLLNDGGLNEALVYRMFVGE